MEIASSNPVGRVSVRKSLVKVLRDVVGHEPGGGFQWTAEKLDSGEMFGGPGSLRYLIVYMTLGEVEVLHRWDRMHRTLCRSRVLRAGVRAANTNAEATNASVGVAP